MAPRRFLGIGTRVSMKQDMEERIARGVQGLKDSLARLRSQLREQQYHSDVVCSDLCERCARIPWARIKTALHTERFELFEMTRTLEELQASACPSCRIFGFNLPSFDVRFLGLSDTNQLRFRDKHDKYWLPSSLEILDKEILDKKIIDKKIIDKKLMSSRFMGGSPWNLLSFLRYVDIPEVKDLIKICVSSHTECKPQPCGTLSNLKVIDCYNRTVILAPESCQFVALSYVWGQPTKEAKPIDSSQLPTLPDVLPRTVEDSIKATKMLGYQYLWVDRYCINQQNTDDQHRQISQMGAIYSSAQVTLIAAAGTDATSGLPGVSYMFSHPEFCSVTTSLRLVSAPKSVTQSVSASTWYSRAWTLQEGYLSKRRLFLVEHGIGYICDEDLQDEQLQGGWITGEITASLPSKMSHWDRANHMMRQFAGRSLTYEDDALNAIIGALGTLGGIDHTEGVILRRLNSSEASSIEMALNWYHHLPCSRRKEFPSWSPLGWRGHIDYLDYHTTISSGCSLEIWHNGRFRPISDAFEKLSESHGMHRPAHRPAEARFLRLSTIMVKLDFEYIDNDVSIPVGLYVRVPYSDELDLFVLPFWDVENVQNMQEGRVQMPCAVAVRRRSLTHMTWRCEQETQILIMQQSGTHYERIGCFNLNWSHHSIFGQDKQGQRFPVDFTYGNPLLEYGDGTFWKKNGEESTFLLG